MDPYDTYRLPRVVLDSSESDEALILDGVRLRGSLADCRKAFDLANSLVNRLLAFEMWADELERHEMAQPERPRRP